MRKMKLYGAVLATLLFVGAGCASSMKVEGDKSGAESEVDVTVDAMLKDADEERAEQAEVEKDADDASSGSAELDAMLQADYEPK